MISGRSDYNFRSLQLAVIHKYAQFAAPNAQSYLTSHRGIAVETLNSDRFFGCIAVDNRDNIIFPHYDGEGLTGYSIKNVNFTGFSSGGTKAVWQSNQKPDDNKLVIVESAIDALSYQQLFDKSNTRYLATGGSLSSTQKDLIVEILADACSKGLEIVIATDNDKGGDSSFEELVKLAPRSASISRSLPSDGAKDWNELLLAQQQKQEQRKVRQSRRKKERGGFHL